MRSERRLALAGALAVLSCAVRPAPALEEARMSRCEDRSAAAQGDAGEELLVENYGALVAPSGEVVFLSTAARAPQLFRGSLAPAGPPAVQLTRGGEGIPDETGARRALTADGRHILFKCHEGFCRARASDGGGLLERPGLAGSMYQFGPFLSAHPGRFFFEARLREEPGLHILSDSFEESGPPRLLFRATDINGWLQDVSSDGRRALVLDLRSHSDWALVLVDLKAGAARQIYPRAGEAAKVRAAVFSADGRRIYAGTDGGRERALLVAFDTASGQELGAYEEKELPTAEIAAIAEAPSGGGRLALALSAGNTDRIRLLDAGTLRVDPRARFDLPLGVGGALAFAPGGERLVFEWMTPNRPRDLYVADLATGAMAPLPSAPRPSAFDVEVEFGVERVPSFDGLLVPTNVLRPRSLAGARLPVVVHLGSGPQASAKLERTPLTNFFLRQGFAVVEPNVRGAAGFGHSFELLDDGRKRLGSFEDVAAVGRWVARQDWADPRRLVLAGASYSGYQALVGLTRTPGLWRAGIDLYGIADWRSFFEGTNPGTAAVYAKEVGSPSSDGVFLDSISPLRLVENLRAPLFVYHGEDDRQVPVSQSRALIAAASRRGVPVTALLAPGEGHGMERAETRRRFYAELRCFLREVLQ